MTDIPRLRAGHVGAQFWAAYVPVTTMDSGGRTHPATYALEQIDLVHRLCSKNARTLAMAYTAADVERNAAAGKTSCLIGIEGGHAIENSLGALRMFYKLGTRYMTLTHWRSLDWATASTDTARRGLSPFGTQVVLEMNRLGMLVDLSHVNDQTMSDALHASRAPVIFSHSSARALANHPRNVPDSILKLVAANRGVVMVNFNPGFRLGSGTCLGRHGDRAYGKAAGGRRGFGGARRFPKGVGGCGTTCDPVAGRRSYRVHPSDRRDRLCGPRFRLRRITEVPVGLEDVSKFPDLIAELLRRGWTEADVKKVAGLNTLRVLRDAERVAVEMRRPSRR